MKQKSNVPYINWPTTLIWRGETHSAPPPPILGVISPPHPRHCNMSSLWCGLDCVPLASFMHLVLSAVDGGRGGGCTCRTRTAAGRPNKIYWTIRCKLDLPWVSPHIVLQLYSLICGGFGSNETRFLKGVAICRAALHIGVVHSLICRAGMNQSKRLVLVTWPNEPRDHNKRRVF